MVLKTDQYDPAGPDTMIFGSSKHPEGQTVRASEMLVAKTDELLEKLHQLDARIMRVHKQLLGPIEEAKSPFTEAKPNGGFVSEMDDRLDVARQLCEQINDMVCSMERF